MMKKSSGTKFFTSLLWLFDSASYHVKDPENIFSLWKGFPGYNWAMESLREIFCLFTSLARRSIKTILNSFLKPWTAESRRENSIVLQIFFGNLANCLFVCLFSSF